jgi:hypothetical protein
MDRVVPPQEHGRVSKPGLIRTTLYIVSRLRLRAANGHASIRRITIICSARSQQNPVV